MGKRKDRLHLENDEIDFINSLFGGTESETDRLGPQLQFEVSNQTPQLMELLSRADGIWFDIRIGRYLLQFYPRVQTQRDGQPQQLVLGYPHITEQPGKARSCRIDSSDGTLRVTDTDGRLHGLTIVNISATGMALTADPGDLRLVPGTTQLRLRLRFPDTHAYTVECAVVHVQCSDNKLEFGVKFGRISRKLEEKLKVYLYLRILAVPSHP